MTRIGQGRYKDQDAVVLEGDEARAVILPRWGAKLASLVHKASGTELLWQNPGEAYRQTGYAGDYGDAEFSGADEMFPTITRCHYESAPWSGVELPDHGEVWSLPWESEVSAASLCLKVHGVRLPYILEKEVSLEGCRLMSRYRATNPTDFPLDFVWTSHPLFNTAPGMEFIVPSGMDRVLNSVPGPVLPTYGESLAFPEARPRGGKAVRLDRMPPRSPTGWQKYWFAEPVTEGWCMLHDPASKLSIGLAWPREEVPYLGMWLNEGGWAGQYNIAPEPATAAMDRLDASRLWGMGSSLAPRSSREWWLSISLAAGARPRAMDSAGSFVY